MTKGNLVTAGIVVSLIPTAIVSRDFDGWSRADLTSEQERQIKGYYRKLEAGQGTEADRKAIDEIYSNRAEIITPKSPDCGRANVASSRP